MQIECEDFLYGLFPFKEGFEAHISMNVIYSFKLYLVYSIYGLGTRVSR